MAKHTISRHLWVGALVLALLGSTSCQLSEAAQSRIHQLELEQARQENLAEQAETPAERLAALEQMAELKRTQDLVRAEDYGRSAGYVWEIALAALGLGGIGAARTFGRSRASEALAEMRARLEAFEKGYGSGGAPVAPAPAPPVRQEEAA